MSYGKEPEYIDGLLILRGLSSLGVLFAHSITYDKDEISFAFYLHNNWEFSDTLKQLFLAFLPDTGGNFVIFFFILSGYLMGKVFFLGSYQFSNTDIIRYYKSRFLRIAPLLYFNLIICAALFVWSFPHPLKTLGDFLFINNITGRSINQVTWSLSYEMQYYLMAPFVFYIFGKDNLNNLLWIFFAVIILSLFRVYSDQLLLAQCFKFLFVFLAGFSVNILLRTLPLRKNKFGNFFAIVFGFFAGNLVYYYLSNLGRPWLAFWALIVFAMGTVYLLEIPRKEDRVEAAPKPFKILFLRFWTWMGILSYGIYLWHFPILHTQHIKTIKFLGVLAENGYVFSKWQETLIYHMTMLPLVIFLATLVSLVTFFLIEIRYRPNLYSFGNSRYLGKYFMSIFK